MRLQCLAPLGGRPAVRRLPAPKVFGGWLASLQAQALPAALSGRDVLGIAQTGSGEPRGPGPGAWSTLPDVAGLPALTVASPWRVHAPTPPRRRIYLPPAGKTAAFVLPMIVHVMDQPELDVSWHGRWRSRVDSAATW